MVRKTIERRDLKMEPEELRWNTSGGIQKVFISNPTDIRRAVKVTFCYFRNWIYCLFFSLTVSTYFFKFLHVKDCQIVWNSVITFLLFLIQGFLSWKLSAIDFSSENEEMNLRWNVRTILCIVWIQFTPLLSQDKYWPLIFCAKMVAPKLTRWFSLLLW